MNTVTDRGGAVNRTAQVLLALASVAVAFAAADTYVVVLALPDMMESAGVSIEQLQKAAPIISGFLLGYVAMLPLIGRIADLHGRIPVLVACLLIFAVGSLVTALAYDMPSMVAGRFLQGVGGGGLVPATLALVADLYPVHRRGVPLGVVSAVQEIGSVLGPLFGALVLAVADWRAIFAINLAVGLLLAAAIRTLRTDQVEPADPLAKVAEAPPGKRRRLDAVGLALLTTASAAAVLVMVRPNALLSDITWGSLFIPYVDGSRWLSPIGLIAIIPAVLLVGWCLFAKRPLLNLRGWWSSLRDADLLGATLLAISLGGVILAFATADPEVQVFSDQGEWYLGGAAVAVVLLVLHLRRAENPLIPRGAISRVPAWGSLIVSFFVGAALIAALIDIPIFARTTLYHTDQLAAALVLVRFLVALPVGAIAGGFLTRVLPSGVVTAVGMLCAATSFYLMSQWDYYALESWESNIPLVLGGLGFGLALAPVNAALLATTEDEVHGVASALVVVARMVGMLVGISALTTIALRRYWAEQREIPPPQEVCDGKSRCSDYFQIIRDAGIVQEQVVFQGAAICALVAAVLALALFHTAKTRGLATDKILHVGG